MQSTLPPLTSQPAVDAKEAVQSLLRSAFLYADARLRIASLEGRDALRTGAWMAMLGTLVIFSLGVVYVGGMYAAAWGISQAMGVNNALPGIAVLTSLHLVFAAAGVATILKAWRTRSFFHATRKEFMEDKRWLEAHHPSRS